MPLWIIFIAVSFLLGLSISFLLDYPFQRIERAFFSFVVGHALSLWIAFLIACLNKSLSISVILICIGICAFASIILFRQTKKTGKWSVTDLKGKIEETWYEDKYTLSFLVFVLLYVAFMNLYGVFRPDDAGSLYAFHTVWADYPFHTSIITSFVYRDTFSFPLAHPQFLDLETHYPFIMDFYSAVLMKGGLDLRSAIIIPNVLFQLAFFGLLYFLAYRLTGLKGAGIGATVIFILVGFPGGLQSTGIHFLNPMYAVIMPQRTAIIGMAISFVVYLLLFHALCANKQEETSASLERTGTHKELVLAGVLIGLLPYIHAHSFIATGFVALFLAVYSVIKERDWRILVSLFLPLMLLSLPQVQFIWTGVSQDFLVFFPGWADTNREMIMGFDWSSFVPAFSSAIKTVSLIETFWAINAGGLLVLLSLGFYKARSETRIFYLPFILLFVIANVVKFQPWYFDNYKLFLHWLALSAIMAALALCWLHDFTKTNKSHKALAALSIAALLIASTVFGVVTHVNMVQNTYMVWSGEEIQMAEWVRANTVPDSVFLTGSAHNHPIPALTGRQRVMGYEGWLWSHGINWTSISARKNDIKAMYRGDFTVMQDYGVDYVCIGPYERTFAQENHFTINEAAFNKETRFALKYYKEIAGGRWRIYEIKTPSIPA
ncbi:MAG: hypothetical protein JJE19_02090 [Methanosarcinales archaeon]|nr:hypothetical protein [Methanosarcinales archaeon]